MRIFICAMDDPMVTNDFTKEIIRRKKKNIVGLYVPSKGQFKTKDSGFDLKYAYALSIIAGPVEAIKQFLKVLRFKLFGTGSIVKFAEKNGIKIYKWKSLNSKKAIREMKKLEPDIIIHQTQEILKRNFLQTPSICVLNRHNSLLPKYRGRLAPFWALYHGEKETGVTIHTVTEKIDRGQIVAQKRIKIYSHDNYVTITKKCYDVAPKLMIKAIDSLKNGLPQGEEMKKGSYFSSPNIKDAKEYRRRMRTRLRAKPESPPKGQEQRRRKDAK